jgi:hypothetical protein
MPVLTGERLRCAACGADGPDGARFCAACGRSFAEAIPTASLQPPAKQPKPRRRGFRRWWWVYGLTALVGGFALLVVMGSTPPPPTPTRTVQEIDGVATLAAAPTVEGYEQKNRDLAQQWDAALTQMNTVNADGSVILDALAAGTITMSDAAARFKVIDGRTIMADVRIQSLPDVPVLNQEAFRDIRTASAHYSAGVTLADEGLTSNDQLLLLQGASTIHQAALLLHQGMALLTASG